MSALGAPVQPTFTNLECPLSSSLEFLNDLNGAKRWNDWNVLNVWNGPIRMMNGRILGGLERAQRWNCWNRWSRMSPNRAKVYQLTVRSGFWQTNDSIRLRTKTARISAQKIEDCVRSF